MLVDWTSSKYYNSLSEFVVLLHFELDSAVEDESHQENAGHDEHFGANTKKLAIPEGDGESCRLKHPVIGERRFLVVSKQ